jgi:ferritin
MYKEFLIEKINKVVVDEITTSMAYTKMAEALEGININAVAEILHAHADEEHNHFKSIVAYAYNHGVIPILCVNADVVNGIPSTLEAVILYTQNLEQIAIADYKEMSVVAEENGDSETAEFFKALMLKEMEHFDDMAAFIGQKREIQDDEDDLADDIDPDEDEDSDDDIDSADVKLVPGTITLRSLLGV